MKKVKLYNAVYTYFIIAAIDRLPQLGRESSDCKQLHVIDDDALTYAKSFTGYFYSMQNFNLNMI